MGEKLVVPRRRVRKNWYEGLSPDPTDRTQNDVHDDSLIVSSLNATDHNGTPPVIGNFYFHLPQALFKQNTGIATWCTDA